MPVAQVAVIFCARYASTMSELSPRTHTMASLHVLEGCQQRLPAVHALYIRTIKTTAEQFGQPERLHLTQPMPARAACAQRIVSNLPQAFRRPVTSDDLAPLMRFYEVTRKNGESFDVGVRESLSAILASPLFLYRAETAVDQGSRNLSDLELASRMSFFIWSSLPDDELLGLARRTSCRSPRVLKARCAHAACDSAISFTRICFRAHLPSLTRSCRLEASSVKRPVLRCAPAFKKELERSRQHPAVRRRWWSHHCRSHVHE